MKPSLDPRIVRLNLPESITPTPNQEHWQTFEVFHQKKRGDQASHVGIVHAPTPEMALLFAKEQFGRRQKTANIWIVPSSSVYLFHTQDEDIFETTPEKKYREASGYTVRDKINAFKKEKNTTKNN